MTPSLDVESGMPVTTFTWRWSWSRVSWSSGWLAVSGAYGFTAMRCTSWQASTRPSATSTCHLTPLLSAASVALLGVSPTAVRCCRRWRWRSSLVLVALIAGDLRGSRRAQVLAAITTALSAISLRGTSIPPPSRICSPGRSSLAHGGCSRAGTGASGWRSHHCRNRTREQGHALVPGREARRRTRHSLDAGTSCGPRGCGRRSGSRFLGAQRCVAGGERLAAGHHDLADRQHAAENRAQFLPLLWLFTGPLLFPVGAAGLVWILGTKAAARPGVIGWPPWSRSPSSS